MYAEQLPGTDPVAASQIEYWQGHLEASRRAIEMAERQLAKLAVEASGQAIPGIDNL
ncbi:MAG: hypothetical protein ACREGF_04105 [Candidatus Saccharimonadales bacterium]